MAAYPERVICIGYWLAGLRWGEGANYESGECIQVAGGRLTSPTEPLSKEKEDGR